jgi:replicative DNA helicase
VQEKSTLRRAAVLAQQIMNRCLLADGRSADILADAEVLLSKLGQKQQSADQWLNPGEVIDSYPGGINGFFAENRGGMGINTPWPTLTRRLCGLGKGELVVLAGRPSMGKSIVAMQLAHHAAKEGHGAAFFSLEMTRENLTDRLISAVGGLDYRRLRERRLDSDERMVAARAAREIWNLPLKTDDGRSRSVPAITSALRKLIAKQPIRLVLVDYVQLMRSTGRPESRREGVSEISHSMKHLASEFGVTVVLLSQLNRECEIEKRQPRLSDLSESGALEHDADVVLFVDRPEMRDKRDPSLKGLAEFIVGKQRNGPTGKIHMRFQGEYQRFVESTDRNEESRGEAE